MYRRPVCLDCNRVYGVEEIGLTVMERVNGKDKTIWDCDRWMCPDCGHEVLGGFGLAPIAQSFDTEKFDRNKHLVTRYFDS